MSLLTCAGAAVLRATIALPRLGVWSATLLLDTDTAPSGAATLASADGSLSLAGTVDPLRSRAWAGRTEIRLVGGAGGLSAQVTPRFYRNVPVRLPLGDLLRDCGETLDTTSDTDTLSTQLAAWTREATTGGAALRQLLGALPATVAWRMLANGHVWVGPETWPDVTSSAGTLDTMHEAPGDAAAELAGEVVPAALVPGTLYNGRRVSYVEHVVTENTVRTRVLFEQAGATTDRLTGALESIVSQIMRRVLYHCAFPSAVLSQEGDGTLTVRPDGGVLPDLVGVPLRQPAPGYSATVTGGRVLVMFEGGDPAKPVATLFDQASGQTSAVTIDATTVKLGAGASVGAARLNDTVDVGQLTLVSSGSAYSLNYQPPGAPAPTGYSPGNAVPLQGKINSASSKVKTE